MQRGYIKVWRKTIDSGWLQNHKLCSFWLWCLLKATHQEYNQIVGCQTVHLMPGEFVFGRKVAAKELKMSEQEIRTLVDSMRKRKNLTIKSTNKFSIISIVNWETYQDQETIDNQQINQPLTNNQPTTNHKQECKELKNKRNNIFIVPSVEEIKTYCQERKNKIDPQYFIDYQTARDWKLKGGSKIKDWKAVIRTWEKNDFSTGGTYGKNSGVNRISDGGLGIPKEYIPEPKVIPTDEEIKRTLENNKAFKKSAFGEN